MSKDDALSILCESAYNPSVLITSRYIQLGGLRTVPSRIESLGISFLILLTGMTYFEIVKR